IRAIDTPIMWSGLVGLMATETSTAPTASGGVTRTTRGTGLAFASPARAWQLPAWAVMRLAQAATAEKHRKRTTISIPFSCRHVFQPATRAALLQGTLYSPTRSRVTEIYLTCRLANLTVLRVVKHFSSPGSEFDGPRLRCG